MAATFEFTGFHSLQIIRLPTRDVTSSKRQVDHG